MNFTLIFQDLDLFHSFFKFNHDEDSYLTSHNSFKSIWVWSHSIVIVNEFLRKMTRDRIDAQVKLFCMLFVS